MKKQYQKPQFNVVELQHKELILDASAQQVKNTTTNLGADDFEFIGDDTGYTGDIR